MFQQCMALIATLVGAIPSLAAEWPGDGAYRFQCEVRGANKPRESVSAGVFVDLPAKLNYYLGIARQTADEGSLRVVEIEAEGKEVTTPTDVRFDDAADGILNNGAGWLSWNAPEKLAAGPTRRFMVYFNARELKGKTRNVEPTQVGFASDDFALAELGEPWDFGETNKPVISGSWHCTAKEGRGAGGDLVATADGKYPAPTIGWVKTKINADEYYLLKIRARRSGPTEGVRLRVNTKWYPTDATGEHALSKELRIYTMDMRRTEGWEGTVDGFYLAWGYGAPPTEKDGIIIDWIRLERSPVLVVSGELEARNPKAAQPNSIELYDAWYRTHTNTLHVYFRNNGTQNAYVHEVWAVKKVLRTAIKPTSDPVVANWHRVLPTTVPPGKIGDLTVSLKRKPLGSVEVGMSASDGSYLARIIAPQAPPLVFTDITFESDFSGANLYWAGMGDEKLAISSVEMDGVDVTGRCELTPEPAEIGFIRVPATEPFTRGEMVNFRIAAEEASACYSVRVIQPYFVMGTYGNPYLEDFAAHGLNHYLSFRSISRRGLDRLERLGMTGAGHYVGGGGYNKETGYNAIPGGRAAMSLMAVRDHPALMYHYVLDEPDCHDYHAGGLGRMARVMLSRDLFLRALDPVHPTMIQIDTTYRSGNYRVYSELTDIAMSHRYALGDDPWAQQANTITELRLSSRPQPYYWIPHFFRIGESRFPTTEEMQIQLLDALGRGVKGLVHYIHSSMGRGTEGRFAPELWDSMTALHWQVRRVGDLAVRGTAAHIAKGDRTEVTTHALVCADEAVVIALINNTALSEKEQFTVEDQREVKVTVRVPHWLKPVKLLRVLARTEEAKEGTRAMTEPVRFSNRGGTLTLIEPKLHAASLYVLLSEEGAAELD